ncbi:MAG TPA: hypothetical protein VFP56_05730 [Candidatus Limnocylindrales bacterium]|nr:hypothetical protein [Candidatus Limnocylindrales bacterium]
MDLRGNSQSALLTLGREYVVYMIEASRTYGVQIRVLTDVGNNAIGLYPIEMFEIVGGNVPDHWMARVDRTGVLGLGPESWLRDGFWEDDYRDESGRAPFSTYEREESIEREIGKS